MTYKEHLPVLELRFGDTGSLNDPKRGWHTLGELVCSGDRELNLFNDKALVMLFLKACADFVILFIRLQHSC